MAWLCHVFVTGYDKQGLCDLHHPRISICYSCNVINFVHMSQDDVVMLTHESSNVAESA